MSEAREVERHLRELPGVTRVELVELVFPRGGAVAAERLQGWVRIERERWKARTGAEER